jgi:histidyl-tRNA synthetase
MSGQDKKDKKKDDKKKGKDEASKAVIPIELDPPSGTRDFFPPEMRQQRYLYDKFREVARLYGFEEYDAPVLEHEDLYKRKAGEEITEQMYNFIDKDGARVTLRPEMTPSLARMILSLMRAETGEMSVVLPVKWFSIPQCWRYETTQRGRKREHYQWNMDIVGEKGILAEAELLSAICAFFESVGITSDDVGLKVNSRKVLNVVLRNAGVPDDRFAETCVILDKQDKIGADAVCAEFQKNVGLSAEVSKKIVRATAAKTLDEFAAVAGVQDSEEVKELRSLFELAKDYGYGDWIQFDASVVRGLAYYTGVVFEGFDKAGVLRAICGGGRYDRLISLYGSAKEVPCVGFGFGDCVIAELLKEKNVKPELPKTVDFVVAAFSQDFMGKALSVARKLRLAGKSVDIFTEPGKKLGKAYNYADRIGARKLALVAPSEWEKGLVRVKDLRVEDSAAVSDDEKQRDIPFEDLANIDSYFGGAPAAATSTPAAPTAAASGYKAAPRPVAPATAGPALEDFLKEHPYVGGYSPSARDRELYNELQRSSGRPTTQALARWYDHIESFPLVQRNGWN